MRETLFGNKVARVESEEYWGFFRRWTRVTIFFTQANRLCPDCFVILEAVVKEMFGKKSLDLPPGHQYDHGWHLGFKTPVRKLKKRRLDQLSKAIEASVHRCEAGSKDHPVGSGW